MILHWQTVPEGTRVSREDFDRTKAEELADLARWEAQARQRRLTSDSDSIVKAMAQLAVQGGETAEAGRIQAVLHELFREFGQRAEFVEDTRVHGTTALSPLLAHRSRCWTRRWRCCIRTHGIPKRNGPPSVG